MAADPYTTLGVARGASEKDVKSAYRKLAKELHPDRNQDDPEAPQRFKEINAAYQILSDPQRRQMFDRFGVTGDRPAQGGGSPFGGNPFGGGGVRFDFSDIPVDGRFADLLGALGIKVPGQSMLQKEVKLTFEGPHPSPPCQGTCPSSEPWI